MSKKKTSVKVKRIRSKHARVSKSEKNKEIQKKPEEIKEAPNIQQKLIESDKLKEEQKKTSTILGSQQKEKKSILDSFDKRIFLMMTLLTIMLVTFQLSLQDKIFSLAVSNYNIKIDIGSYNLLIYLGVLLLIGALMVVLHHSVKPKDIDLKDKVIKKEETDTSAKVKKIDQKKESPKELKPQSKKEDPEVKKKKQAAMYSNLFILAIVIFLAAAFFKNVVVIVLSFTLMFLSLMGYSTVKGSGSQSKEEAIKAIQKTKHEEPTSLPKIELGKYETDLDTLYKLVNKYGSLKVSTLAKHFKVKPKKVEEWATILETSGLLLLHYPILGEPNVMKVLPKEEVLKYSSTDKKTGSKDSCKCKEVAKSCQKN